MVAQRSLQHALLTGAVRARVVVGAQSLSAVALSSALSAARQYAAQQGVEALRNIARLAIAQEMMRIQNDMQRLEELMRERQGDAAKKRGDSKSKRDESRKTRDDNADESNQSNDEVSPDDETEQMDTDAESEPEPDEGVSPDAPTEAMDKTPEVSPDAPTELMKAPEAAAPEAAGAAEAAGGAETAAAAGAGEAAAAGAAGGAAAGAGAGAAAGGAASAGAVAAGAEAGMALGPEGALAGAALGAAGVDVGSLTNGMGAGGGMPGLPAMENDESPSEQSAENMPDTVDPAQQTSAASDLSKAKNTASGVGGGGSSAAAGAATKAASSSLPGSRMFLWEMMGTMFEDPSLLSFLYVHAHCIGYLFKDDFPIFKIFDLIGIPVEAVLEKPDPLQWLIFAFIVCIESIIVFILFIVLIVVPGFVLYVLSEFGSFEMLFSLIPGFQTISFLRQLIDIFGAYF